MNALKRIVLVVLLIPILLVVVSLFLPSTYRVERSMMMNARAGAVFPYINSLKQWPEWTDYWSVAKYPGMEIGFGSLAGPEAGVGASYVWEDKSAKFTGPGRLRITTSEPDQGVGYELDFQNATYVSRGAIALKPMGESVNVTWSNEGNLGWNPVSRFFGLFMDAMMGPDFEEGLRNLQRKVEPK